MTLLQQLKQKDFFTETEYHIINYLLEHLDQIDTLTINELSKQTFSSNASIIRLCKKLSFSGFKQLKVQLVKEIESNKYISKKVSYSIPFQFNQTSYEIIDNMYSLYNESIKLIQSQINKEELIQVAEVLMNANRIFIYAIGDTKFTTKAFINKMIKINYYPILATADHEELFISQSLKKGDCALFVSYGGKNDVLNQCIQICHQKNIETIIITANQSNPIIRQCLHKIMIPNEEKEYKIATFYSQFAIQYILNIIFAIIYNHQ
ncbi:MurR/RpiR family transcriptional regulator [Erysipelatoclostridium sp. AM42-17]|uniref:MurR/RpiR family transcriptional regulator n=1 Tax=Erysipelatoclostridium sp. AM42-17 TaxID=2293102 RepID=UPI000E46D345|nr:MurR/RpiR family transcriptional regulator [Erysipelatoclostridium sp. AM42-17]RHS95691.1 MurR/RpiR family transcriptional regulator [Erysipelatoclostridium sp. AM42-17]